MGGRRVSVGRRGGWRMGNTLRIAVIQRGHRETRRIMIAPSMNGGRVEQAEHATAEEHGLALLVGYGRGAAPLATALEARGMWVLELERFSTGLREFRRLRPETVLVGTDPLAGDPYAFLRAVVEEGNALVLFLADRTDSGMANLALESGADDIVCPPHSAAAIMVRHGINLRRRGGPTRSGLAARRLSLGALSVDLTTRQVLDGAKHLTLSGREFELLVRLMEAGGNVVSREALLQDIWGVEQDNEAVLDATVHRLRRKLDEVLQDPDVVATVRGVGYRLEAPLEPTETAAD